MPEDIFVHGEMHLSLKCSTHIRIRVSDKIIRTIVNYPVAPQLNLIKCNMFCIWYYLLGKPEDTGT